MSEESETELKKPAVVKEVPVVQDQGYFVHETGDVYDGLFEAKKKDHSAKMHGVGVYTTAEGDIYSGIWEADRLGANEEVTIKFTDTARYEGHFKDWSYAGAGRYYFPDGSILQCDFVENCPNGRLTFVDPNRHIWLGKSNLGYAWLDPVNHYYASLETTREIGKIKRRHKHRNEDL